MPFRFVQSLLQFRNRENDATDLGLQPLGMSARAADQWTDISTPLLERLTNQGAKLAWPGGCSGVVVNRTNGEVTIKVLSLGLWRSADQGKL